MPSLIRKGKAGMVPRQRRKKRTKAKLARKQRAGDGLTAEERARQALERNAAAIDATTVGTPSGRQSGYRVGKAPSSYRQGR